MRCCRRVALVKCLFLGIKSVAVYLHRLQVPPSQALQMSVFKKILTWLNLLRNARRFPHSHRVDEGVPAVTQNGKVVWSSSLNLLGTDAINFVCVEGTNTWDVLRDVASRTECLRFVCCVVPVNLFYSARVGSGIAAGARDLCLI